MFEFITLKTIIGFFIFHFDMHTLVTRLRIEIIIYFIIIFLNLLK